MPGPSIYRVPDDIPSHLLEFLALRFIQPGDWLYHYPEDDPPHVHVLYRVLSEEGARELEAILPHLKHEGGPEFKRSTDGEGWYLKREK